MCKIIPACLNFRGTVAANEWLSAPACQSAIFGKIGRNYRNLAGTILHSSVVTEECDEDRGVRRRQRRGGGTFWPGGA